MVDYSKWGNLEISDDEDETHPNIDSILFQCLHQEKDEFEEHKKIIVEELLDIASQVGNVKKEDGSLDELLARIKILSEGQKVEKKEDGSQAEIEAHLKSERQKVEKKEDGSQAEIEAHLKSERQKVEKKDGSRAEIEAHLKSERQKVKKKDGSQAEIEAHLKSERQKVEKKDGSQAEIEARLKSERQKVEKKDGSRAEIEAHLKSERQKVEKKDGSRAEIEAHLKSERQKVEKKDGSRAEIEAHLKSERQKVEKKEDGSRAKIEAHLKSERQKVEKEENKLKLKVKVIPIKNPAFKKVFTYKLGLRKFKQLSENQKRMHAFIKENEELIMEFGMLRKYYDSSKFIHEHTQLVCEETLHYLFTWCINLEMEDKQMVSQFVAHQLVCILYIFSLSKKLGVHPRVCALQFFMKIHEAEPGCKQKFDNNLNKLKELVKIRKEVLLRKEKEEKQAHLGPGGLDPLEVFDSLPPILQQCFF